MFLIAGLGVGRLVSADLTDSDGCNDFFVACLVELLTLRRWLSFEEDCEGAGDGAGGGEESGDEDGMRICACGAGMNGLGGGGRFERK